MQRSISKLFFYLGSFSACILMALTTGCASGGFKLTRQYATWVNSQQLIIRIVLYLLTGVVFAVTLLIDLVVFNTMDFWQGRVSAGDYDFKSKDNIYHVKHEILADSNLKRSTIQVKTRDFKLVQTVVISETSKGVIEMRVDGILRASVRNITQLPMLSEYNSEGKFKGDRTLNLFGSIALNENFLK